jgi:hypothetical protein
MLRFMLWAGVKYLVECRPMGSAALGNGRESRHLLSVGLVVNLTGVLF